MSARDEEEYEEKLRQRRMREREKAYRDQQMAWESRERRRIKEYERELKREEDRREDMVSTHTTILGPHSNDFVSIVQEHERRHLAEFLQDYDDDRDDQQFYKYVAQEYILATPVSLYAIQRQLS